MTDKQVRWSPAEYVRLAFVAWPRIREGADVHAALFEAQATVLIPERRIGLDELTAKVGRGAFAEYLDRVRHLKELPADLSDLAPPRARAKPKAVTEDDAPRHAGVRWTTLEVARVAREVRRMQAKDPKQRIGLLVFNAQKKALPKERRRSFHSLEQSGYTGALTAQIEAGWRWGCDFVPGYLHAGPLPDDVQPIDVNADKVVSVKEARELPPNPSPKPTPVIAMTASAPKPAEAQKPAAAPTPAPEPLPGLGGAAAAFAGDVSKAVYSLFEAFAREQEKRMTAAIDDLSEKLLAQVHGRIDRAIEAGLAKAVRQHVAETLAAELGGPVEPKPAPSPAAPFVLKADILGIRGNTAEEVRRAMNGHADLRFVPAENMGTYAPRDGAEVYIATRFCGHDAERKCDAYGVKPFRVNGAASSMILALEKSYREHTGTEPQEI